MRKSILRRLSLRAKLKGNNVEVVVINVETGEIQYECIPLKLGSEFDPECNDKADSNEADALPDTSEPEADVSKPDKEDDE